MPNQVFAYSMDVNQKIVEEGLTDKRQALENTKSRLSNIKDFYENPDEALVDGFFGFYRSKDNFVEISIIDREWGSYIWYEGEEDKKFFLWSWRGWCQYEIKNAPVELVLESVENFFDFSTDEFLNFLKDNGARRERNKGFVG